MFSGAGVVQKASQHDRFQNHLMSPNFFVLRKFSFSVTIFSVNFYAAPLGGRFSHAPPFMKLHRIHVHQRLPTGPSFVKAADSRGGA